MKTDSPVKNDEEQPAASDPVEKQLQTIVNEQLAQTKLLKTINTAVQVMALFFLLLALLGGCSLLGLV